MKDIFEIRIHGRGGQGAKTAAQFIAEAAIHKGKHIQAFPEYGPERSGAPMAAFVRISENPIKTFEPVVEPDVIMVLDNTLTNKDIIKGLKKDGILIVNTPEDPKIIKNKTGFKGKTYTIDATKISLEYVGKDIPNTPMLAALSKITKIIDLDSLNNKVKEKFLEKIGEERTKATIDAIKKAYGKISI